MSDLLTSIRRMQRENLSWCLQIARSERPINFYTLERFHQQSFNCHTAIVGFL